MSTGPTPGSNPNVKWCTECKRYYNKNTPHECEGKTLRENREQLEQWLKRFKIKQ